MKIFKAPQPIEANGQKSIFLAGSIDMGNAANWQHTVTTFFANKPCNIFNPRRDDWDSSWEQKSSNKKFNEQVNWELHAMEQADLIIMNFLPQSQSPITLLEFGLFAKEKKLMVCCPDEFWRSGNIQVVCEKFSIPLFKTMEELLLNISF
jgi:hypothetical protein